MIVIALNSFGIIHLKGIIIVIIIIQFYNESKKKNKKFEIIAMNYAQLLTFAIFFLFQIFGTNPTLLFYLYT